MGKVEGPGGALEQESSLLRVSQMSPQALFCRGTHGLAADTPSPTASPADARVTEGARSSKRLQVNFEVLE